MITMSSLRTHYEIHMKPWTLEPLSEDLSRKVKGNLQSPDGHRYRWYRYGYRNRHMDIDLNVKIDSIILYRYGQGDVHI